MTIIAAVIIFGVLIFVHEFGHFATAKLFGVKVHEFSIGMGPAILKKKKGETAYSVRALPIGGYVRLEGEDFASEDERAFNKCHPFKRIIVLVSGAFMNVLTGFLIFSVIISFAKGIAVPTVSEVIDGSPAQNAGIMAGDVITSVNGKKVHIQSDVTFSLYENGLSDAEIKVRRGKETLSFNITPLEEDGRYVIGFYPSVVNPNFSLVLKNAWYNTFFVVRVVVVSLKQLVLGKVSLSQMSGPVGIVGEIGQAAQSGILDLLYFAALIAVNLGVMNLLPLPALDGGRVLFALAELLTGKPVKPEIEGYIHAIGFALLIVLMVVITYSDIVKLVT